jgi:hypothetical protein
MSSLDALAKFGADAKPADLRRYFRGRWSLLRRIEDRRRDLPGTLLGEARFEDHATGLLYRETGRLRLGHYDGRCHQSYFYGFPDAGRVEVRFADGRFFHALDLTNDIAEAEHLCAQDHYRTRVELTGAHRWTSRWQVLGPAKDLILTTWYVRIGQAPTCHDADAP